MSRPEDQAPAAVFYNDDEARKYATNSRMIEIQSRMSERAVELLNLSEPGCLILDIGCGSGLSGDVLTEEGHAWIGLDISRDMLEVASEREVDGDLIHGDAGDGFGFTPGCFDGAISISALQWLCNAEKTHHVPFKRLCNLFESLFFCLRRGSRAVFQFYPANPHQIEMITQAAVKSGFLADLIIDFPNSTKAKKYYLVLYNGPGQNFAKMQPIENEDEVPVSKRRKTHKKSSGDPKYKSRDWILSKKARQRRIGKEVRLDTKYTGRKRKRAF
jgi:18S rRNA (guanine1575-N7)-methyltransferase